jgi:signal transduction histidine kinase
VAAVAGGTLCAVLAALAAHDYLNTVRRSTSDQEDLASERTRIKSGERASLARELHDQLGHQLSLVALQVNAVDHVSDPVRLREALVRIDATLDAASDELAALLAVMDAAPASVAPQGPTVTPSVVARLMTGKLIEHGHPASLLVDDEVDHLDPTTRLTVVRVLQEATTNVLRHGARDTPVRGCVSIADDVVSLTLSNTVPAGADRGRLADLSTGYGLRGIRERVDVSGGTFVAGVVGPDWQVAITLPLNAERVAVAAHRDSA